MEKSIQYWNEIIKLSNVKWLGTYLSLPEPDPLELLLLPFSLADSLPDSVIEPFCNNA